MTFDTLENFVDAIRANNLLDSAQLVQLDELQDRYPDPDTLACELVLRGFLTRFQAEKIFQGEAHKLLLGQYIILQPIGEGGMGVVFKARHARMKRVVALKVIRKDAAGGDSALQRFNQEIEAAAQLSHPNVVIAYDANDFEDTLFFVMEYVDGIDLGHLVRRVGPLPVGRGADYIRQAALGLQHAHERGMVHRDIKPSNLLLAYSDSIVKILDMGLARLQQSMTTQQPGHLTSTGMVMGTPDFISPEQARDARSVDIRSDLYSLGCTLYFILAGQPPFPDGSFTEKLLKHNMDRAQPIQDFRPEVPAELMAIIDKLMAKNPKDRYQTPIELARALTSFAQSAESAEEYRVPLDDLPTPQPFSQTAATQSSFDKAKLASAVKNNAPASRAALTSPLGSIALPGRRTPTEPLNKSAAIKKDAEQGAPPPNWKPGQRPTSKADLGPRSPVEEREKPEAKPSEPPRSRAGTVVTLAALVLVGAAGVAAHQLGYLKDLPFASGPPPATGNVPEPAPSPTTRPLPPPTIPAPDPNPPIKRDPPLDPLKLGTIADISRPGEIHKTVQAGFSRNGGWLATINNDRLLRLWRLQMTRTNEKRDGELSLPDNNTLKFTSSPAVTATGQVFVGLLDPNNSVDGFRKQYVLAVWDGKTDDPSKLDYLMNHTAAITAVAVTPDGAKAITASSSENACRVWDGQKKREICVLRKPQRPLAVAISDDGRWAITAGINGKIHLWDLASNPGEPKDVELPSTNSNSVNCVVISPDNSRAVTGEFGTKTIVWDLANRKQLATFLDETSDKITCVNIASDNVRIFAGGDGRVLNLWNVNAPKKPMFSSKAHKGTLLAAGFVGNGDLFGVSVGSDQKLRRFALPFTVPAWPTTPGEALLYFGGSKTLEPKPD